MANQKITDLDAITSAEGTDVIEIVSDPGVTPVSKKITVDNLIGKSGAMAVQTNPKAMAQGVYMTAATSGSTGIAVADDDDIDFGTGNYTLVWRGVVPDYTPSADVILMQKTDGTNGWLLQVDTTGVIQLIRNAGAAISSTSATSLTDGTEHEIVCAVTTETASVAGSVVFYVDGKILGSSVAITAGAPTTVSNAVSLYVSGTSAVRSNLTNKSAYTYNRALSASEVLDLYRNGIAFADKWGSQTAKYSDTAWTGASGATRPTGWSLSTAGTFTIFDSGDSTPYNACLKIEHDGVNNNPGITKAYTTEVGKKYKFITFFKHGTATNGIIRLGTNAGGTQYTSWTPTDATWTKYSYEFKATTTTTYVTFYIVTSTSGQYELFDETFLYQIGSTVALEPEGIQPAPGQWLDSSTNKLHAMQPASGSSLTRKKDTFEVRWTNTWAGTHEAQYIGGFNQAVLPANCYITDIIGVVSGTTIEDIIIGDGSDTDRWVAATTGLAAGTTAFTLANRISDGTNYKLVVDPDANFTGSIAWTIKGIILQ